MGFNGGWFGTLFKEIIEGVKWGISGDFINSPMTKIIVKNFFYNDKLAILTISRKKKIKFCKFGGYFL